MKTKKKVDMKNKTYAVLSILSFTFALFILSMNITGNVIGSSALNDNRWMGVCFFLCGLTFTFFYLRGRN